MASYKRFAVQIPFYSLIAIIFSLAVWSLLFPQLFGEHGVGQASAADFGTSVTAVSSASSTTKTSLIFADGTYYLAFSTGASEDTSNNAIFIASSTNGVDWSEPAMALDNVGDLGSGDPVEFGFVYNTVHEEFALAVRTDYSSSEKDIIFTTSSDAVNWSATTTVVDDTGGGFANPNPKTPLAFSTTTGMYALGYFTGGGISITTSTVGSSWSDQTTVAAIGLESLGSGNIWLTDVVDLYVMGDGNIHMIYDSAPSSSVRSYEVLYASSSDFGSTWTTSSATGILDHTNVTGVADEENYYTMRDATRVGFSPSGNISILYYTLEEFTQSGGNSLDSGVVRYAELNTSDYTWSTSTIASSHEVSSMDGATRFHNTALVYYGNSRVATAVYKDLSAGGPEASGFDFRAQPTSSLFTDTDFISTACCGTVSPRSKPAFVYRGSVSEISFAYVEGGVIKYATSTLRDPDLNSLPTSTPTLGIDVNTDGGENAGRVTITTTITDADDDTVSLSVEYSIDGGETWDPITVSSVTLGSGSASTGSGSVTGIADTENGNTVSIFWNSSTDEPDFATTTTKIRLRPSDTYGSNSYVISDNFEIDNEAPSATVLTAVSSGITTSTLTWAGSPDIGFYYVSSTFNGLTTTTASTTDFSSLTPNTQYSYQIFVNDAFGNTSGGSPVTSSYTNAAVPTSVAGSAQGTTSILVTWSSTNASGSTYELYNATTDAVVATTQSTSYTVTGLTQNTSYQFKVRTQYLSDSAVYSAYSALSSAITTQAESTGGGGSIPSNPPKPAVNEKGEVVKSTKINNDAASTASRNVTLQFDITGAVQMAISNNKDFIGSSYESYQSSRTWQLTEGNGQKVVYVKFRAGNGSETLTSDTIMLTGQNFDATDEQADSAVPGACPVATGSAYKASNSSAVYYITKNCEKRPFTNATKFFSYFTSWDNVQVTSAANISSVAPDPLGFMPWGPIWDPKWGAIVKHPGDPKVYLLLNDEKYWITSETVFESLYGKDGWGWIEDVDPILLENYNTGSVIDYTDHHPNYTIIKYGGAASVYRLEPDPNDSTKQVKRHIANEAAFEKLGFRWDRIVQVKDTEVYADGEQLK